MKKIFILFFSFLLFNSCNKEDRMDEVNELTGNSLTSGLLKLQVNSECVPFQVEHSDYAFGTHYQEIVNSNYWDTSWIAHQGDNIYIRAEDHIPDNNYPNGILRLVEIKIIYKDDIIGSAQKFFSHDNDGVYIYATTVP